MASIAFFTAALVLALGAGELRHRSHRIARTQATPSPAQRVRPTAPTLGTPGGHGLKGAAQHA